MNATSTITHVQPEPKPWRKPEFAQPVVVKPRDLRPLGEIRGYRWWTLPGRIDGELCERPVRLTDDDVLPNGVLCQRDDAGERSYAALDVFPPGSFARYEKAPPRIGPPAPAPLKFADALPALYAPRPRVKVPQRLGGIENAIDGRDRAPVAIAPRVRLYGAAALLAEWARQGVVVTLGADGVSLVVRERRGLLDHNSELAATMRAAAPLVRAHLRGEPLTCVCGTHAKDEDASAVTVGLLGAPCCLRHAQERG